MTGWCPTSSRSARCWAEACRCRRRSGRPNCSTEPAASALLTTAGNPVCTAAGRAVLATITGEQLPERAAKVGAVLQDALRALDSELIGDVRGRGLAIGLELVNPATGEPDPRLAGAGELPGMGARCGGVLRRRQRSGDHPPLVLSKTRRTAPPKSSARRSPTPPRGRSMPRRLHAMPDGDITGPMIDVFDGVHGAVPDATRRAPAPDPVDRPPCARNVPQARRPGGLRGVDQRRVHRPDTDFMTQFDSTARPVDPALVRTGSRVARPCRRRRLLEAAQRVHP